MSFPPMADLQAALENIPFASSSQPACSTFALFNNWTPITHMPAPQSPIIHSIDPTQYNEFAITYNNWQCLVDEVGVKATGLPPMMKTVPPQQTSSVPIEVWLPPHASFCFSPMRNGLLSIPSSYVPLPASLWRPSQLHTNIPSTVATLATPMKGLGKSSSAKPNRFNGDKLKYVQWSRQIAVYFVGFNSEPNNAQKILMTLSYIKGNNAARWFADLYIQQQGDQLRQTLYLEFKKHLDGLFMPAALKRQAENELLKLKQGKETVEDYFVWMNQLILQVEYSTITHSCILISITWRGLKNKFVEFVKREQPALMQTNNFDTWVDVLVQADQVLCEIEIKDRKRGSFKPKQCYRTATAF